MTLSDGPDDAECVLVLAHGAGAPMDSPFMSEMATRVAAAGVKVVRFEFPYMARQRAGQKRGAPDRMPVLEASFREVVRGLGPVGHLFVGGKSMGSRVATQLADELGACGALALGYPFHPPKKPEQLRVAHLSAIRTPCLIVQGTRDALGLPHEIAGYPLSPSVELVYVEDGDHSLEPRKSSGRTLVQNLDTAGDALRAFMAHQVTRAAGRDR